MAASRDWALILGASSGFGEATAIKLAEEGFNICGIHLDRKSAKPHIEEIIGKIEAAGGKAKFINMNASAEEKRAKALEELAGELSGDSQVRVLLHSLAFGTLKPFIDEEPKGSIDKMALDMTVDVMANSLVYWAQDLVRRGMMKQGGRIFALTSAGSLVVWKSYGAVSAAKCAVESHCRQLAVELAEKGITANALMAGVTETPALAKIPGAQKMVEHAKRVNPYGRLTQPSDIANAIALLSRPEAAWITGNVIKVDGGEAVAG